MKRLSFLILIAIVAAAHADEPAAFSVRVTGSGPAMILIPGLASPGEVWSSTVEHYQNRYTCHVLTLAGFAGQPSIQQPLIETAQRQLASYIRANKLDHPMIVGHSLGGFLALSLAASEPDLVGPIISVDGVPFLPALLNPSATAESAARQAEGLRAAMAKQSAEEFAAHNRRSLTMMITSRDDVDRMAAAGAKSDPRAVGEATAELMSTDLRPAMSKIRVPVLLIGAGGWARSGMKDRLAAAYEAQVASVPKHRFVLAEKARHFIMLDDPQFLFATIDAFLESR
ncbi:MAG TPA: alpha/beta hydrolase [Thermoanaerobaculia bacterium]|jgi:pimeloyl-ACP methyl ester carboxylesterase|nr:alpha/beta hydrolase [Thermoanaerobaculia bacterium]